jgi:hypothetical protein
MIALEPSTREIGRMAVSCLLGVRFRDLVTGDSVSEGLRVTATLAGAPTWVLRAVASRSGIFSFPSLPGLRAWERWADNDQRWTELSGLPALPGQATADFIPPGGVCELLIEVRDAGGRFLPCQHQVRVAQPGPPVLQTLPLFSAPARLLPPNCAVVRTQLRLPNGAPAAHALLRVSRAAPAADLALALADAHGSVAAIFPCPEPPSALGITPRSQQWNLGFTAWEAPAPTTARELPDPSATETDARRRRLFTALAPDVELASATLHYGRELILPDRDPQPDQPRVLHLKT